MRKYTIAFDLDGTLCENIRRNYPSDILKLQPKRCNSNKYKYWIDIVNALYEKKYFILIYTSRREKLCKRLTLQWLKKYNVRYSKIIFNKPRYDILIDDKALSAHQEFITPAIIENNARFIWEQIDKNTYDPKKAKENES